ncbi:MAG: hypothetical protein ABIM29_03750 [candidate division WOR-3 bacterium]
MLMFICLIFSFNLEMHYEIKEAKTGSFSHNFKILYFPFNKTYGFGARYEFWDEGDGEWWRFFVPKKYGAASVWYHTYFGLFLHKSFYFLKNLEIQFEIGIGKWNYKFYEYEVSNDKYNFTPGYVFAISPSFGFGFRIPSIKELLYINFSNITPFIFGTPEFLPPGYSKRFEYYFPAIQPGIGVGSWWKI